MSNFVGFKVAGIDRNRFPGLTINDMTFRRLYFLLEPIDGHADAEAQIVWKASFLWAVKNLETHEDFNDYKEAIEQMPDLNFIPNDNDSPVICAEGSSFSHLADCIDFILLLVKHANSKFKNWMVKINRAKELIDQINSSRFGN